MSKKHISKQDLIAVLNAWSEGDRSTEQMQGWMLDNYEPLEVDIGLGEAEITREAMNIVMNEYELADEQAIVHAQAQLAIDFIECDERNFNQGKKRFIQKAFTD